MPPKGISFPAEYKRAPVGTEETEVRAVASNY